MEHFSRANPSTIDRSIASSVSSLDSVNDSAYSDYSRSTDNVHRRAASYSPSYMNAKIPVRKPVGGQRSSRVMSGPSGLTQPLEREAMSPPPPLAKGTLLLAIAAMPHKSTNFYVESMVKKTSYKQIYILGTQEYEMQIKQLKMDTFALLGKLGKEAAVIVDLQNDLHEVEVYTAVSKAVSEGESLHGVLCIPDYSTYNATGNTILTLDQQHLEMSWQTSVFFLHNVAKQAMAKFRSANQESKEHGLFLTTSPVERSPISMLNSSTCRTLMTLLVEGIGGQSLTIDYADNILLPEPEPQPEMLNGGSKPSPLAVHTQQEEITDNYPPPESPTKLWALYSEACEFLT